MKVLTKTGNSIAINPRDVIVFIPGEIIESGIKNITDENLHRMIELGFADEINDDYIAESVSEKEIESDIVEKEPESVSQYEFESFTDKDTLFKYAIDVYSIELDKRQSLSNMIAKLKEKIESDTTNLSKEEENV